MSEKLTDSQKLVIKSILTMTKNYLKELGVEIYNDSDNQILLTNGTRENVGVIEGSIDNVVWLE